MTNTIRNNISNKNIDNKSSDTEDTNPLPVLSNDEPFTNNSIVKDLNTLLNNSPRDKINCLPCKALQEYKNLHDHYNNVKNNVIKTIKDCGFDNYKQILYKIENEYVKCNDFNTSNEQLSDIEIMPKKKTSYIGLIIQVIIIILFILFIYFFERKRCICPLPSQN